MFPTKRPTVFMMAALLLTLTSCANSSAGKNLEQSLAADPKLKDNPVILGRNGTDANRQNQPQAKLPADFPSEIPLYPNAQLQTDTSATPASGKEQVTRWRSSDPGNAVQSFYQNQFQNNNWQLLNQKTDETGDTLEARRNDLKVTVLIQPNQNNATPNTDNPSPTPAPSQPTTQFTLQYVRDSSETVGHATASPTPDVTESAQPSNPAVRSSATPQVSPSELSSETTTFSDLNKVPQELRSYVTEVAQLGVLTLNSTVAKSPSATNTQFEPNKIISRGEYARWLIAANNKMHAATPAQQIRPATPTSTPTFQDVPRTHPDFGAIQGLAEAGLIPSPLSGDSTAVLFRPGVPLTREQMMLWKVPLDTRQSLPNATFEAVKQTWGFQDATKIEPKALRVVLADFQNGDMANIRRLFGYTTLFQPKKPVTRAEAAATLWYFGSASEGISAKEALQLKP